MDQHLWFSVQQKTLFMSLMVKDVVKYRYSLVVCVSSSPPFIQRALLYKSLESHHRYLVSPFFSVASVIIPVFEINNYRSI